MNAKQLMRRFLEEEGFRYEWDEECVCFKFQGLTVNVLFYDSLDLLIGFSVSHDTELPRYVTLDMCNELNQKSLLKYCLADDNTIVVLHEEFYPEKEVGNESVMADLELLINGAAYCRNRMNELTSYLSHSANKMVN